MRAARIACPSCLCHPTLRPDGTVRRHRQWGTRTPCPASGMNPNIHVRTVRLESGGVLTLTVNAADPLPVEALELDVALTSYECRTLARRMIDAAANPLPVEESGRGGDDVLTGERR